MTRRDKLLELIRQRAAAILEIGPLAKDLFPVGQPVKVRSGGELVDARVLSCDYAGETWTVRLPGGGSWSYPLNKLLEWNPTAGLALADVA